MADKYRIVSDGRITKIYAPNGDLIKNATSIEISQKAEGSLMAYVTLVLIAPEIDVQCESLNG